MDDDIVEFLEAEARDAEAKASATRSSTKKRQILERMAERVRYFKLKMLAPHQLDALEARVSETAAVEARCGYCDQPRGPGKQCRFCGAAD